MTDDDAVAYNNDLIKARGEWRENPELRSAESAEPLEGFYDPPGVVDPRTGEPAMIDACRSCGAQVYWGETKNGKLCPYNIVDGEATTESHFGSCPQATAWSKKKKK